MCAFISKQFRAHDWRTQIFVFFEPARHGRWPSPRTRRSRHFSWPWCTARSTLRRRPSTCRHFQPPGLYIYIFIYIYVYVFIFLAQISTCRSGFCLLFMHTGCRFLILRWGWVFLKWTRNLSGIHFTRHFIEFVVVETKRFVDSNPNVILMLQTCGQRSSKAAGGKRRAQQFIYFAPTLLYILILGTGANSHAKIKFECSAFAPHSSAWALSACCRVKIAFGLLSTNHFV